jgi:hypothetical protein
MTGCIESTLCEQGIFMKIISVVSVAAVVALPLFTSCSTMRVGAPVKAGYEVEEPSWALRYIPGLKAVSDFIPPPNEARMKWDEAQKKRGIPWEAAEKLP